MSMSASSSEVISAIAAIEGVSSRIEETFAQSGDRLGRGHAIFQDLNQALAALSQELSGAQIEGASQALHDIAGRLNGWADVLLQIRLPILLLLQCVAHRRRPHRAAHHAFVEIHRDQQPGNGPCLRR